jgi:hypothetical protein
LFFFALNDNSRSFLPVFKEKVAKAEKPAWTETTEKMSMPKADKLSMPVAEKMSMPKAEKMSMPI